MTQEEIEFQGKVEKIKSGPDEKWTEKKKQMLLVNLLTSSQVKARELRQKESKSVRSGQQRSGYNNWREKTCVVRKELRRMTGLSYRVDGSTILTFSILLWFLFFSILLILKQRIVQ